MTNFFKATHKTTGEVVSFGLEDICSDREGDLLINGQGQEWCSLSRWLQDYSLQYHHDGEWHDYKLGGENDVQ